MAGCHATSPIRGTSGNRGGDRRQPAFDRARSGSMRFSKLRSGVLSLPPGLCGARAAVGLIMPSVDKVGRYFPLTMASAFRLWNAERGGVRSGWLDAAETLGRLALDEDAPPRND